MTTFTKVTVRLTVWTMSFFCEKLLPLPWLYLAQDYRVLKKTWQKNPGWHKVQVCAAGNDDFYDSSGTWCFSFGQFLRRQVRRDCGELCMPGILCSLSLVPSSPVPVTVPFSPLSFVTDSVSTAPILLVERQHHWYRGLWVYLNDVYTNTSVCSYMHTCMVSYYIHICMYKNQLSDM